MKNYFFGKLCPKHRGSWITARYAPSPRLAGYCIQEKWFQMMDLFLQKKETYND